MNRVFQRLVLFAAPLAFAPGASAQQSPQVERKSVDTPADAVRRSDGSATRAQARPVVYGGGLFLVDEPESDLEEPLPIGTEESFQRRGYEILRDDNRVEVVVDPQGQIYTDRNYQGVIPALRPYQHPQRFQRARGSWVSWVGFQPMANVSRVFWQLTDPTVPFEIVRVDDKTLHVFFPNTRPDRTNELRPLVMASFESAVERVEGQRVRGGLRYVVRLKRPANYLYRVEAPFLFIDFER